MLAVDSAVQQRYPGTQMGILAMRGVDAKAPPDPELISNATATIQARYGQLDRATLKALPPVTAYVDYYRRFGYSYHVLGQLESLLSGKRSFRAASGLLACMFLTELESMVLTAGHDLDTIATPLTLGIANGDEEYTSLSGNAVKTVSSDLMVSSAGRVISSILRGPDSASRITDATSSVLFTLYAPPGVERSALSSALHALEQRIRRISPGAQTLASLVYPIQSE